MDLSTEVPEPVLAVDNLTGERHLYQYGPVGAPLGVVPLGAPQGARWFITDAHGTIRAVTGDFDDVADPDHGVTSGSHLIVQMGVAAVRPAYVDSPRRRS